MLPVCEQVSLHSVIVTLVHCESEHIETEKGRREGGRKAEGREAKTIEIGRVVLKP